MGFQYTDEAVDVSGVDTSTVSCSICLETVSDNGDRSWAKLLCGHQFHLDCIGSAFNVKGAMQCPNCRKIEKGQWLYANGGCAFPEFNVDDWTHEEDLYDFRYPEMSLGVHWCPFNGLTRLPTTFNEGEFTANGYHELLGQHAIPMEHASATSGSHPCPYVAYVSPLNSSSSNLGTAVSNGSNFTGHWTVNETPNSYALPSMDVHYHGWDHPSPHITASNGSSSVEQTSIPSVNHRYSRPNAELPRSASFMQPLQVGHSSAARAGNMASSSSSMTPPYPGSNARARDRVQALQAYYQRPNAAAAPASRTPVISGNSRRVSNRGGMNMNQVGSVPSPSRQHQINGFLQYLPSSASSENTMPRGFRIWESDQISQVVAEPPTWGTSFHQPNASSDSSAGRFNAYRQRRASERGSTHNRS